MAARTKTGLTIVGCVLGFTLVALTLFFINHTKLVAQSQEKVIASVGSKKVNVRNKIEEIPELSVPDLIRSAEYDRRKVIVSGYVIVHNANQNFLSGPVNDRKLLGLHGRTVTKKDGNASSDILYEYLGRMPDLYGVMVKVVGNYHHSGMPQLSEVELLSTNEEIEVQVSRLQTIKRNLKALSPDEQVDFLRITADFTPHNGFYTSETPVEVKGRLIGRTVVKGETILELIPDLPVYDKQTACCRLRGEVPDIPLETFLTIRGIGPVNARPIQRLDLTNCVIME